MRKTFSIIGPIIIFRLILVVRPLPSSDSAPSNLPPTPLHLSLTHPFPFSNPTPPVPSHPFSSSNHTLSHPSFPPTPPSHTLSSSNPALSHPLSSPTPPSHTPSLPLTTPSNTLLFLQPHPLTHPSLPPIPPSHTPSLPHLIPSALNAALTPLPSSDLITLQPHFLTTFLHHPHSSLIHLFISYKQLYVTLNIIIGNVLDVLVL